MWIIISRAHKNKFDQLKIPIPLFSPDSIKEIEKFLHAIQNRKSFVIQVCIANNRCIIRTANIYEALTVQPYCSAEL